MKIYPFRLLCILVVCLLYSTAATAQDFVYTPVNPAFGGNTFNYNWLLSSATAQNGTTDPDAADRTSIFDRDPLEEFRNSLNRQILSQLSRNVLGDQFTDGQIAVGTFTVGDFTIDVVPSGDGVVITIIDLSTGGQSTIEVPNI